MRMTPDQLSRAFAHGTNFAGFLDTMKVNRPAIEANYAAYELTETDMRQIETWKGVTDVVVLAHDWCGDVVANLPLFAKIEAQTGKLKLHILPKDPDNRDIGQLYPHEDGDVHIPLYVFFDAKGKELGHLIERTPELTELSGQAMQAFWARNTVPEGPARSFDNLSAETRSSLLSHLGTERTKVRLQEKNSLLAMLTPLLS